MNRICFIALATIGSLILPFGTANADYGKPQSLKTYGSQVESTTNQDGSPIAFIVEPDREVTYVRKAPGNDEWSKPKSLDIYANQITTGIHADGRITVFNIGTLGNVLYYVTQLAPNSDEWSEEKEIKGFYASQIQGVSLADGRLALFFLDMGREIGFIEETSKNSGTWASAKLTNLNGNRFEVGKQQDGSLDIAIIGTMANVLSHARMDESGNWVETDIDGSYAIDIALSSAKNGDLWLFFVKPDKEIAQINLSTADLSRRDTDMYGIDIETANHKDGSIELFIVGTMASVLSSSQSTDGISWGKEGYLKGYGTYLNTLPGSVDRPLLFTIAPMGREIYVYE